MSVHVMALCWEVALDPSSKLILLALADHANESGGGIFPGNGRLAHKAGISIRQVQRHLTQLESLGLIYRDKYATGGRGHAVQWSIDVEALKRMSSSTPFEPIKGDMGDRKGRHPRPERVTPVTLNGDMGDTPTISNHQESSRTTRGVSKTKLKTLDPELLAMIEVPPFDKDGKPIENHDAYRRAVARSPGMLADLDQRRRAGAARGRGSRDLSSISEEFLPEAREVS